MISVEDALTRSLELARHLPTEEISLSDAGGRVLAQAAQATHDQPPFDASAMDGYAVRSEDVREGATFTMIAEAAAGRPFDGEIGPGQCARIFTGAPMPRGTDRVIIQEDVSARGTSITLNAKFDASHYVRKQGSDFTRDTRFAPGVRLGPAQLGLLATMNVARVTVAKRPEVAIIATGDELVEVGTELGNGQIVSSNSIALAEMAKSEGATARILPIAADNEASLKLAFTLAGGADLIVTTGGASVGDHDLVAPVARALGLEMTFYKVAMRPGKPLMAGRLAGAMLLGLPGNPVSAQVCGHVFVRPILRQMQGLAHPIEAPKTGTLAAPIEKNGPRQHYMRAIQTDDGLIAAPSQDSARTAILSGAQALIIRPPHAPAAEAGTPVSYLTL